MSVMLLIVPFLNGHILPVSTQDIQSSDIERRGESYRHLEVASDEELPPHDCRRYLDAFCIRVLEILPSTKFRWVSECSSDAIRSIVTVV